MRYSHSVTLFSIVSVIAVLLVLSGCQAPLKIAICENGICEYGEDGTTGTCPADCPDGAPVFDTTVCDSILTTQNICVDVAGASYSVECSVGDITVYTPCAAGESCASALGLCVPFDSLSLPGGDGDDAGDSGAPGSDSTPPLSGPDTDGDGVPDSVDADDDGDGVLDIYEGEIDDGDDDAVDPGDFEYESTYPGAPGAGDSSVSGSSGSGSSSGVGTGSSLAYPGITGECVHNWKCSDWGSCQANGLQGRTCEYTGTCETQPAYPQLSQKCVYSAPPSPVVAPLATCYDRLQNQGEGGVDCGGPCSTPCEKIAPTIAPVKKQPLNKKTLTLLAVILLVLLLLAALAYWKRKELQAFFEKLQKKQNKGMPSVSGMGAGAQMGNSGASGARVQQYATSQHNYGNLYGQNPTRPQQYPGRTR